MFWTVSLSLIRSLALYKQHCWLLASKQSAKPIWHIPIAVCTVLTPDDGQRNCPKHVEFYSKNTFEKLLHLVSFIIRILFLGCILSSMHWHWCNMSFYSAVKDWPDSETERTWSHYHFCSDWFCIWEAGSICALSTVARRGMCWK